MLCVVVVVICGLSSSNSSEGGILFMFMMMMMRKSMIDLLIDYRNIVYLYISDMCMYTRGCHS